MARIGFGYDSHRFAPDRPLVLGGVVIDYEQGLAGHSDADVVLHALTDAILGAIAAGDIGQQFPDTDPRWKGADSTRFLTHAVELAMEQGLAVANADITILAEAPKLGPAKKHIADRIGGLLNVSTDCVSVKAKTGEGMDAVGRGEGIAAMAAVLLEHHV
jgi:2-C-methyl-D-erythritol 2,4-cyclodiphosphate synthase